MATVSFIPTESPATKGASKRAHNTRRVVYKGSDSSEDAFLVREGRNSRKNYMTVKFSKGTPADIYEELKLYSEFGQRGISPIIYYIKVNKFAKQISLSKFLRDFEGKNVQPYSYFVEKSNCGEQILNYYGSDFVKMFSNLRHFIEKKIVENNLVHTDIKIQNLCIDDFGNFKMIDLDPNFIKKIQTDPLSKKTWKRVKIDKSDYVDYMLFQVYSSLCVTGKMPHDPQLFELYFTRESLIETIERLSSFEVEKEHTHPINTLLYYAKTNKNRNQYWTGREIFDDIMSKCGDAVPLGVSPTALSPTAPSPTETSSMNSNESMSPSVFRMDSDNYSETHDLPPQKLFDDWSEDYRLSRRWGGGKTKKFLQKKKTGGDLFKLDSYEFDRRFMKARNLHTLRLNIEDIIEGDVPLDENMERNLRRIHNEAKDLENIDTDFQHFFFSDAEVKLTKYEIQKYHENDDKDLKQYLLDLEFFSKKKKYILQFVQEKALKILQDLSQTNETTDQPQLEPKQEENIQKCIKNFVIKNPSIVRAKAINICSTINGILNTEIQRNIPEKFDNLLHEWFNENSIIQEIFKTARSSQLCFLHELLYNFDDRRFFIVQHYKKINETLSQFSPRKYFENEIEPCDSKLIAIPFIIQSKKENWGHATIIVIDRTGEKKYGKDHIIIEHFDSSLFSYKYDVEKLIYYLTKQMFGSAYYADFIGQMDICPYNIQGRLLGTKYKGTCSQFQLWYAFKRLLEPDKTREEIIDDMNRFLDKGVDGMIQLIKSFQELIRIKLFDSDEKTFTGRANRKKFSLHYQEAGNRRTKRRERRRDKHSERKR
jgi:hypothetical protein